MAEVRTFHFELTTPQATLLAGEAISVVLPAADGMMGVLANRAPMLVALGSGLVTIRRQGRRHRYTVHGGLAAMRDGALRIVAEQCEEL